MTSAPTQSDPRTSGPRTREVYLDALRTAAIVRVVAYHTFVAPWMSWALPAMGLMFALAGGLMVRSLDRQPTAQVLRNRFRRLLPALWLFGAIMVPLMFLNGWGSDEDFPLRWPELAWWVVPVLNPPTSGWGWDYTVVLWYLRTYLWLVALSPLLLPAFRRWPVPTFLVPLGVAVAAGFGLIPEENPIGDLVISLGVFGGCWLLGFAHRDGRLARIPMPLLLFLAAVTAAAGAVWALTHPTDEAGAEYDLNGIPLAQALWSMAFVAVLLRFDPKADWIGRTPVLGRLVALVNARAVTIYLWHNVAINAAVPIDDWLYERGLGVAETMWWQFLVTWVLIAVMVVLFGWVEDLAARRRPRLFPTSTYQRTARPTDAGRPTAVDAERPAPVGPTRVPEPGHPGWSPAGGRGARGGEPAVYGRVPHGRAPREQAPHGEQAPRGRDPYGQPPRGRDPYGQPPLGRDPYGQPAHGGQPLRGQARYGRPPRGGQAPREQAPRGRERRPGGEEDGRTRRFSGPETRA